MNKLKMFFTNIILVAIIFAMIVVVTLIYSACNRSHIKTYIFQTGNYPSERVGELQSLQNISPEDLRNKLIKKYVSEYFKVIPDDTNAKNRSILKGLSAKRSSVYSDWQSGEALKIAELSSKRVFRIVSISDGDIAPYNKSAINDETSKTVYYVVKYNTLTWTDSNIMGIEPVIEPDVLYIEIEFKPELLSEMNNKPINIREYLRSGQDPSVLFYFRVHNIKGQMIR